MAQRTCAHCGTSIEGRHGRAVYCSKGCSVKASHLRDPGMRQRHQAKYRQSRKGRNRRRSAEYFSCVCKCCGETWQAARRDGKYCSYICRDYDKWGPRFSPWAPPSRALVLYVAPEPKPDTTTKPVWVSGSCGWCAEPFTTYTFTGARYCSSYCGKRAGKARRRAREVGADGTYTWGEVTKLWMSIGKRCAYCHEPKRNDEIEPDHVVPLSRGGSNSIANVVPACHPCNGDKRDLSLIEWYEHRRVRGLAPRLLSPELTHLTWVDAA